MKRRKYNYNVFFILVAVFLAVACLGFAIKAECASKFPDKTIVMVVPWPAGGRTDLAARVIAEKLQKILDVSVVVANKAGGAGLVGAEAVAQSPPDGYTIGVFSLSHIMNVWTKAIPMDFAKFDFVSTGFSYSPAIMIAAKSPWKSWDDVIAAAKKNPGGLKFATPGAGGADHITSAILAKKIGIKFNFIPYKGDNPAGIALASNEVNLWGAPISAAVGLLEANMVKVLGIASEERFSLYPKAKTHKEQGVDFVFSIKEYFCVAKGTPKDRVETLNAAIKKAVNSKSVQEHLKKIYMVPDSLSPEETKKYVLDTVKMVQPMIEEIGLRRAP